MKIKIPFLIVIMTFLSAVLYGQISDKDIFLEAETRFMNKDYEVALDRYNTLIREYPFSNYLSDSQFKKAVTLYRLGRFNESLTLFRKVETRYRSTRFLEYVPFWKGVVKYSLGDYEEAMEDLQVFVEFDSGDSELRRQALLYQGLSALKAGSLSQAEESFEQLLSLPDEPSEEPAGVTQLLWIYLQTEKWQDAVDLFEQTDVKALPDQWRGYVILYGAEAYTALGRTDDGRIYFEMITGTKPEIARIAYQRLFELNQNGGDDDELIQLVRRAEEVLSGHTDVLKNFWLSLGVQSYRSGKIELAELYLSKVWDIRKNNTVQAPVPLYLAEIYAGRGETDRAIKTLEEFLTFGDDRVPSVLFSLGSLQLSVDNWQEASRYYEQLIAGYRDFDFINDAYYQYAYSLYRMEKYGESIAVIDTMRSRGLTGNLDAKVKRLAVILYREMGKFSNAVNTIQEYLPAATKDYAVRIEYLKLLFVEERYRELIEQAEKFLQEDQRIKGAGLAYPMQIHYMKGLAEIIRGNYQQAAVSLQNAAESYEVLAGSNLLSDGMQGIYPYILFYRGWSLYKLSRHGDAFEQFQMFLRRFANHELRIRAEYLAGWNAFNAGKFSSAEKYLYTIIREDAEEPFKQKAVFLLGNTFSEQNRNQEALEQFNTIYTQYSGSDLADDALIQQSRILVEMDRIEDAVSILLKLFKEYPRSTLAESALYRRGEILFEEGDFEKAGEAFREYRSYYPDGKMIGAALYWGGMASYYMKEYAGALLLWERLIKTERTSSFRPDAMVRSAEIHEEEGDHKKALSLYTELIALYPREAETIDAERKASELRYRILGLDEREAELWVTIDMEGGTATPDGRQAVIELARFYIIEERGEDLSGSILVQRLQQVAEASETDPARASQAMYLLGEYYAKEDEYMKAANTFLEAVIINPADPSLSALSLYKSAQMMKIAGQPDEAEKIADRLEKNYPDSRWTLEVRKLLGDE
jgi:TolA-binding protein